jgi:hypothetical protein
LPMLSASASILVSYLKQQTFGLQKNSRFTGEDQLCFKMWWMAFPLFLQHKLICIERFFIPNKFILYNKHSWHLSSRNLKPEDGKFVPVS